MNVFRKQIKKETQMELVKENSGTATTGTELATKSKDVSAALQRVLAPHLKEGTDLAMVTEQVEIALIKYGSRKVTDFLLAKFNSL
jgi:hypothetical protein